MKKTLMMMALAASVFACFAAQNDPTISVAVEEGASYDVLCKGEKLFSFTSSKTGTANVQGVAAKSMNAGDYQVNLMSTAPAADGAVGGDGTSAQGLAPVSAIAEYVCKYADGVTVLPGERCALVKIQEGFKGFTYDFQFVEGENEIVRILLADDRGMFAVGDLSGLDENAEYELVVLDTRMPDGSLAPLVGTTPKLVSGWGEFIGDDKGAVVGINWNSVKVGRAAVFCLGSNEKTFDYDPTKNLEAGLAAVFDGEDWKVHELPKAYTKIVDNGVIRSADGYAMLCDPKTVNPSAELSDPFELEVTYQFQAFEDDVKDVVDKISPNMPKDEWGCANFKDFQAIAANVIAAYMAGDITDAQMSATEEFLNKASPFWDWNCDFEVSFDRPIKKGTYVLGGHYQQAKNFGFDGWVCSAYENDLVPGESVRLLKDNNYKGVYVTYYEICSRVQEFLCGVINLSPENYGTTMTVKLCIYDNYGRDNESGGRIVIGTYDYTFCGPLDFRFRKGEGHPGTVGLPYPDTLAEDVIGPYTSLQTNHNGKLSFVLPALQSGSENLAFVGWSNAVDSAIMTYVPTNTWGSYNLYSIWKPAKTVVINPDTNKTENVASIKVADDWLEENNLKDATLAQVAEALQKPAEDGGKIPLWQTYVLGLNPSGTVTVVATEKLSEDKALVVSTVEAPAPDAGFKVTYSLDKIDKTSEEPIDDAHKGKEQETKDISIDLEPQGGETPTGYYKMNVFITPVEDGKEQEKVQVKSEVTVGVLTVKTEEPVVPVAIPWTSLAETPDENAEIPADEIVQPQGLTDGDQLFVYDRQGEVYTTLTLTGGKWVADGQTVPVDETGTAGEPTQARVVPTVKRGYGMWLKRQDTSKNFHLFGQYNKTAEKTKIVPPADGQDKAEYNLIAPTGIEDTDLNSVPSLGTGVDPLDKLMIVEKGVPTYYNFNSDTKKWGYNKQEIVTRTVGGRTVTGVQTKRVEEAVNVSAGTGLWYISKGGEPEIDWNEKQGE